MNKLINAALQVDALLQIHSFSLVLKLVKLFWFLNGSGNVDIHDYILTRGNTPERNQAFEERHWGYLVMKGLSTWSRCGLLQVPWSFLQCWWDQCQRAKQQIGKASAAFRELDNVFRDRNIILHMFDIKSPYFKCNLPLIKLPYGQNLLLLLSLKHSLCAMHSPGRLPNQAMLPNPATYCLFRQYEFKQLCRIRQSNPKLLLWELNYQ